VSRKVDDLDADYLLVLHEKEKRLRTLLDAKDNSKDVKTEAREMELSVSAGTGQRAVASVAGPPKPIQETAIVKWQAYFNANSSVGSVTVSPLTMSAACGGYCTTANSVHAAWASSIKLNSITIWPAINSVATQSLVDVVWNSSLTNFTKDMDFVQPSPFGNSMPKGMRFRPPKDTLLAGWLKSTNSAAMMTITMPIGSILLLDVEYTLTNALAGPTSTIATGTSAVVYYLALDGPSSNKIQPLALSTTS
jgi:hypothetical protein